MSPTEVGNACVFWGIVVVVEKTRFEMEVDVAVLVVVTTFVDILLRA